MRYSLLFVIVLILVSGFIAYFGDLIGRRMGKKRLTLFNMRPRNTAIMVTIVTGMVISSVALIVLVTANVQFKKVLTQGEQIFEKNQRLSVENLRISRLGKRLQAEVAQRQMEVIAARRDAAKAKAARDKAVAGVSRLKAEIARRQRQLETLQARTDAAESDLKKKTAELTTVQARLVVAQKNLGDATKNLTDTRKELADASKQLANAKRLFDLQADQLRDQQKRIVELGKEKLDFEQQTAELRSRQLILRQGDEITRGVITHKQSMGIRVDLLNILANASEKAEKLGAKAGSNGRAVSVVFRQMIKYGGDQYAVYTQDERKCIDLAVDAVAGSDLLSDNTLVQVVSQGNTFAGEQAPVELNFYDNRQVYVKGDKIASGRIDGSVSEARVMLAVMDFLQKRVAVSALRKGIVPMSNPDPRYSSGKSPQDQVEGLMALVDRIKSANMTVTVDVYAGSDIWAVDTLNMDNMTFDVSRE